VTKSAPDVPRRALRLDTIRRLVEEGTELGFKDFFFTGGEPFLLDDVYPMLGYASARTRTTVLTNGVLLFGRRLERLTEIANENLRVQVSLDGARPEHHDPYRGEGTWAKTVAAIERLIGRSVQVCISTTETPANTDHIGELHAFRRDLGIADSDHLVRPLARHGFSTEGLVLSRAELEPELTLTAEGTFWHPLTFPGDVEMRISDELFPLGDAVAAVEEELASDRRPARTEFR
jgi:MoaA/NifB/PqqE/SkfB family radical SAM enzyme